jgi:hypothetical protein
MTNATKPEFYVITNSHNDNKKFEKLDDFVEKMEKNLLNVVDDSILKNEHGLDQNIRYNYMKMIFDFIKYNDLEFDLNESDL